MVPKDFGLVIQVSGGLKIGSDPLPEVLGLSDVNDPSAGVFEQVNARFVGECFQLPLQHSIDYISLATHPPLVVF